MCALRASVQEADFCELFFSIFGWFLSFNEYNRNLIQGINQQAWTCCYRFAFLDSLLITKLNGVSNRLSSSKNTIKQKVF